MLRIPVYTVLLLILFNACNGSGDANTPGPDTGQPEHPQQQDPGLHHTVPDTVPLTGHPESRPVHTGDSVIVLLVKEQDTTLLANIRKDYQQIHVRVPVTNTTQLDVKLQPEGKDRNLRVSQIEMPDGKTDGPFGSTMEYTTKKPGIYTLIIARSNMADGQVKGPVRIIVAKH
ncbi:hypothetical protein [Niabella drilacis]|uniref:YtkA-like n=1 Tax=Niabella drilacis (strain DSM 25811 / CCM 8410 / CCUG 62505 / LMG 26954 / E90) TaxID=1285928 RepID=A0A1G6ZXV3_NIADE|nr:hypothetical protein [Niabella drilacis]SDE07321.1 hypothetical protein SAMN04487894_1203 [Niabella drilacis]